MKQRLSFLRLRHTGSRSGFGRRRGVATLRFTRGRPATAGSASGRADCHSWSWQPRPRPLTDLGIGIVPRESAVKSHRDVRGCGERQAFIVRGTTSNATADGAGLTPSTAPTWRMFHPLRRMIVYRTARSYLLAGFTAASIVGAVPLAPRPTVNLPKIRSADVRFAAAESEIASTVRKFRAVEARALATIVDPTTVGAAHQSDAARRHDHRRRPEPSFRPT